MSRSSRDFYYSSSDRTRGGSQSENLPPIRDVVGDVLQQPAIPVSSAHDSRRPLDRSRTPHPQVYPRAQQSAAYLQLPPIRSPTPSDTAVPSRYSTHATTSYQNYSPRPFSQPPARQDFPPRRASTPAHSYDVFVSTSGEGLIHKRSSNKDDFHHVPKDDAIASSTGRHVCAECGRRFEKLSTLKNHLTTHSGEKPYECPDCGKSFSVSSNMRRHQLTHRHGGASGDTTRT